MHCLGAPSDAFPKAALSIYRDEMPAKGESSVSYNRFCKRYREFAVRRQAAAPAARKVGQIMKAGRVEPTFRARRRCRLSFRDAGGIKSR